MKISDPFEKVVEQLFFHLVFQANVGKSFVYASLDGNAETTFGDAIAMIEKVFVFEFKRNLESLSDEFSKFEVASHAAFLERITQAFDSVEDANNFVNFSASAHIFVALASQSRFASNVLIKNPADSSSLEVGPYLLCLTDSNAEYFKARAKNEILQLTPARGMPIDLARHYFEILAELKGKKPSTSSTSVYACFAVNESGSIGVIQCQGLVGLAHALELTLKHNAHVKKTIDLDKHDDHSQSMEM